MRGRVFLILVGALWVFLGTACLQGAVTVKALPQAQTVRTVKIGDSDYVDAVMEFGKLGLKDSWVVAKKRIRFRNNEGMLIEIEEGTREASVNGLRVFLGDAAEMRRGKFYVSRIDFEKVFRPLLQVPQGRAVRVVALDAGHGGKDTGTINTALKLQEKTFTLDLAQRVKRLLVAKGFRVMMTRETDVFIPLPNRPLAAARAGADIFVSIHFNSVENGASVSGIETYAMTPQYQKSTSKNPSSGDANANPGNANDALNEVLAFCMHRELLKEVKGFDRGLKRARWTVLAEAKVPAVLVEAGYLSNTAEARKIMTEAYREDLAKGIAEGIAAYAGLVSAAKQ